MAKKKDYTEKKEYIDDCIECKEDNVHVSKKEEKKEKKVEVKVKTDKKRAGVVHF